MAAEVALVDGLQVAPRVSPHRKTTLKLTEFLEVADARRIRVGFGSHARSAYFSPRHRHNFDQVRFIVAGKTRFGPLHCQAGDCVYFPEGVFYGPTEMLTDEATTCTIQTQGPSWAYYPDRDQLERATAEIAAVAELDRERGRVRWPNGRWQDSYEAAWEHLTGQRLVYPAPRYREPVLLRSRAFTWLPAPDAPGVAVKPLARFNETGPAIRLVRLAPGARLPGGEAACHQVSVVVEGAARYGDRPARFGTILYYPPGARYETLVGEAECTLLEVQLQPRAAALGAWVA
jgi:hypothetical protein